MLGGGSTALAMLACLQAPAGELAASPGTAEPQAPAPRRVAEAGPSPLYFRKRPDTVGWGYRVGLGASVPLAGVSPRPPTRFTLDVLPELDLGFGRGSRAGLMFEGGYSYTQGGTHLFVIGAGPALRRFGPSFGFGPDGVMAAALVGHALLGSRAGQAAAGGRASVLFHVWVIGLEVGYQYVQSGAQGGHELRLMIDLGLLSATGGRGR